MAIGSYNPANTKVYTGLSSDTKPTGANIGDRFIATDTKAVYFYFGTVAGWAEVGVLGGTSAAGLQVVI